jgi:hypothetical protein
MRNRNFKNEELDRIGRKLLDAGKTRREEIERIISSPTLFEAVRARIETERRERDSKSFFGGWASVRIWNWQNAVAALLLFAVSAIGVMVFSKFTVRLQFDRAAVPQTSPEIEQIKNSPISPTDRIIEDSPMVATVAKAKNSTAGKSRKIIKLNASAVLSAKAQKPARRVTLQPQREKSVSEFFALAFAPNSREIGEVMRIVPAELSPSSLFRLGVNLPIENDSEKIKTELLVGTDGVVRAIRFVN